MRLLLDTHAVLWWATDSPRLSTTARQAIADPGNDVLVSAAVPWEIAIKHRLGRLAEGASVLNGFDTFVAQQRFDELAISRRHCVLAGSFDVAHRDPFDRVLAAQASIEAAVLVTTDPVFAAFPVSVLW